MIYEGYIYAGITHRGRETLLAATNWTHCSCLSSVCNLLWEWLGGLPCPTHYAVTQTRTTTGYSSWDVCFVALFARICSHPICSQLMTPEVLSGSLLKTETLNGKELVLTRTEKHRVILMQFTYAYQSPRDWITCKKNLVLLIYCVEKLRVVNEGTVHWLPKAPRHSTTTRLPPPHHYHHTSNTVSISILLWSSNYHHHHHSYYHTTIHYHGSASLLCPLYKSLFYAAPYNHI